MSVYSQCYAKALELLKEIENDLSFPLDVKILIETYFPEIQLVKYSEIKGFKELNFDCKNKLALLCNFGNWTVIAYDETASTDVLRFALSHELGHFVLEHASSQISDKLKENQANCFARNLLAPVYKLKSRLPSYLCENFGISFAASRTRDSLYDLDCMEIMQIEKDLKLGKLAPADEELIKLWFGDIDLNEIAMQS